MSRFSQLAVQLAPLAALFVPASAQVEFESITQLAPTDFAHDPSISYDGRFVAFVAPMDPLGTNPDGLREIWRQDLLTGDVVQITSGPSGLPTQQLHLSSDGERVLFSASYDYATGTDLGSNSLWEYDHSTGVIRHVTTALSNGGRWRTSGDGRYVALATSLDLVTGQNADNSLEVFRVEVATGAVQQISGSGSGISAMSPAIDFDGDVIVFSDRRDYDGTNSDQSQDSWRWDAASGQLRNVTQLVDGNASRVRWQRVDDEGRHLLYGLPSAITGSNFVRHPIYLLDMNTGVVDFVGRQGIDPSGAQPAKEAEISPNGEHVYFERHDRVGLYFYDISGGPPSLVPGTLSFSTPPATTIESPVDIAANGAFVYRSPLDLDPGVVSDARIELFRGVRPQQIGSTYCLSRPNSSGRAARAYARGVASAGIGRVSLMASGLPTAALAVVLFGDQQAVSPLGAGRICVGGAVAAIPGVVAATMGGDVASELDFAQSGAAWTAGSTWHFQFLFRDSAALARTVNLSNAVSITFGI